MSRPYLISESNLSLAWARAVVTLQAARGHRLSPLTVSFEGTGNNRVTENASIRGIVDRQLADAGLQRVQTVANTIFPQSLWRLASGDRDALYDIYLDNLPTYVDMEPHKNARGLYFARLTAFDVDHKTGERLPYMPEGKTSNQLEFIIVNCRPGTRVSMFQASLFDPIRDHTPAAQLGFPCLQHISVVPQFDVGMLELNAFYATQQLFAKAYGNFLGLARLGAFIAGEVGLELSRTTCFVGVEKMEVKPGRDEVRRLVETCERELDAAA